ncbi:MAG: Uma2 family endonuclease [Bacteroidota bacterium]
MGKAIIHSLRTAVEVFKLLPEGVHCQVINNAIYMSPAPNFEHQEVVSEIQNGIFNHVKKNKLGKCVQSPIDVFLDDENVFQPDIIFISSDNLSIIKDDGKVHGAPDIVVEVLSPGNANDDKVKKRKVYESCGVKEYFIVQPSSKEVISYYLVKDKFEPIDKVKGKIVSKFLKRVFRF